MKKLLILILFCAPLLVVSQKPTPTVQDLDFFTGKWEVTLEIYDTHKPNADPIFVEKGYQVNEYELNYKGIPMFLTSRGYLEIVETDEKRKHLMGRTREFQESIRYGNFESSFERIGLYSNWPATGIETMTYDSISRMFIIRGNLNVQNNMLERYVDTYKFNEDYTYFERTNIANFSDMPITEYNLTLKGTGRKVMD
ncbi:hypothetical protein SAMN05421640_2847 [Ekhidna lutea]|uniref:Lipocalin-like domain-containing protein n=1 Tax=Ekhidna lutea TaxID=447679 RepID=A0A239KS39_EKHLU|nr:hypothetical protein [Ekhidna lutea]SNT20552.1 hypothetical protein SAMN05421640_2847 [Ekhidna lutea]